MQYQRHRRRSRKGNGGNYTIDQWNTLCETYHQKCARCREVRPLTVDHVVPVSKGGSSNIDNIQPLCLQCNSWKSTKTVYFPPQNE
jgi:5-methylcytosine-specific restriction endonuclease McrA